MLRLLQPGREGVAGLPIANNSRDANWISFASITQKVIHALTKASGLRVVAWHRPPDSPPGNRTSTRSDANSECPTCCSEPRASAGRIRLLVQLIDTPTANMCGLKAMTGRWPMSYDVEQEISTARPCLADTGRRSAEDRRPTRKHMPCTFAGGTSPASEPSPASECRGALPGGVALDADFALGYAGLADAFILLADYSGDSPSSVVGCARAAAKRALAIDSTLGEAEASLGIIGALHDWNWASAGEHFRRAIELNPSYATAYHWYGLDYLALLGRFTEARKAVRMAVELDPLTSIMRESIGYVDLLDRRFQTLSAHTASW